MIDNSRFYAHFHGDTQIVPNVELLMRTLEFIEEHPEAHYQPDYRKCFAALAARLAGAQFAGQYGYLTDVTDVFHSGRAAQGLNPWVDTQLADEVIFTADGPVHVEEYAAVELGLTAKQAAQIFAGWNDIELLREYVVEYINIAMAEEVPA